MSTSDRPSERNFKRFCNKCEIVTWQEICPNCGEPTVPFQGQERVSNEADLPLLDMHEFRFRNNGDMVLSLFIHLFFWAFYGTALQFHISKGTTFAFAQSGFYGKMEPIYTGILIAIFALYVFLTLYSNIRYKIESKILINKGTKIKATVIGYRNEKYHDKYGNYLQMVELKVNDSSYNGLILSSTLSITRPYEIGSEVELVVYKKLFSILNRKEVLLNNRDDIQKEYVDDTTNEQIDTIPCESVHKTTKTYLVVYVTIFIALSLIGVLACYDQDTGSFVFDTKFIAIVTSLVIFFLVVIFVVNSYKYRLFRLLDKKGTTITGIVIGYTDSNEAINGQSLVAVKIRIDTPDGVKCILYNLGSREKPYEINSTVLLKNYDIYYTILNN